MIPVPASPPVSQAVDNCLTRNEWICGKYYSSRADVLREAIIEHLEIVVISVVLGLVIAFPLALMARRFRRLEWSVVGTTTALYTIPSLALFSLLVPLTGLTPTTVVVGLALYSLTVLVRNMLEGLRAVPAEVRESALGMGYSNTRMLLGVELPLALPAIMAGLRVATVSAVALTTVGAIVGYGGLGTLLLQGKETNFKAQVLATSVLCVVLAVVLDLLLVSLQKVLTPWTAKKVSR